MWRLWLGSGALAGGALTAVAGVALPVAAVVALVGAAVLASAPVLGTLGLIFMSQTDGLFGHVDKVIPSSSFKLLTAGVLAMIALRITRNPMAVGRPRLSLPMAATALFGLWLCLSHIAGPGGARGEDHFTGFVSTLVLVPIVGLTIANLRQLDWAAWAIVLSGSVSGLLVIVESQTGIRLTVIPNPADIAAWGGEIRSAGASAYNPTTASHMVLVSLMVALTMAVEDRRRRWLWIAAALPCLAGLPMMGARSALLALVVGALVLLWTLRGRPSFAVVATAMGLGVLAILPLIPATMWERLAELGGFLDGGNTADRSLMRRLSYNLIGLDLWSRAPILGVGPGIFPELYAGDEFRWYPGRVPEPRQLHNSYLEVAVETGIVGVTLFLSATMGAMALALRAAREAPDSAEGRLARALGVGFAAFLFASLFMPNEDNKYMWILVALCAKAAWLVRVRTEASP